MDNNHAKLIKLYLQIKKLYYSVIPFCDQLNAVTVMKLFCTYRDIKAVASWFSWSFWNMKWANVGRQGDAYDTESWKRFSLNTITTSFHQFYNYQ